MTAQTTVVEEYAIKVEECAIKLNERLKTLDNKFQQVKELDSMVFVEIPARDIKDVRKYHSFLLNLETRWMEDFNGNKYYNIDNTWNFVESGVGGNFGDIYFISCKLFRHDGTILPISEQDWRSKRGLLITDHYSSLNAAKVHIIADNLCAFLAQEEIEHSRYNFDKQRKMIK
ncbi:hypothetical protein HYW75_01930 [Candidatus Pacearchaeota archaeon]|nr:hypothetical protein [Candidatus Pacearchaeota archaeon]